MDCMRDSEKVKQQYSNSDNLTIRMSLHSKYSMNKQGFGNWINDQYTFFNGCRILELGCGNGDMWTESIKNIGKDSTLILSDFSEGMVAEVEEKYCSIRQVSFQQINIEEIPYKENYFDIVIANMMLYHVPDLEKALSEVARVLKSDGIFYSATFGENGVHQFLMTALNKEGDKQDKNAFTLQNGRLLLEKYFNNVIKKEYIDELEITDTSDLINYIFSMSSIMNVKEEDRQKLFELFENRKDNKGIIRIPKEYGMYISTRSSSAIL